MPSEKNQDKPLLDADETQAFVEQAAAPSLHGQAFAPGQTLLNRFRIVRCAGRGGMGEVYEAEDLVLPGRIALKTIRLRHGNSAELLQSFKQEVHLARKITGANVCRIHELFTLPQSGPNAPVAFLTMEYLEGESLAERLTRGPLPFKQAQRFALDLCDGLETIHQAGVLHRDLKTRNVMLTPRHGRECAVLMDFGLALPLLAGGDSHAAGQKNLIAGTPEYMAPEQFEGEALSEATDIFALGVVLYEMVTAHEPFPADTPLAAASRRGRRPELGTVPARWREILVRCLEYQPHARYSSAGKLAKALRTAANPITYFSYGTARWTRKYRAALIALLAALLVVLGYYTVRRMRLHTPPAEARRWYGKGLEALRDGSYVKAAHELQPAIDLDPQFAMAHVRLAEALSDLDFTADAEHQMGLANLSLARQKLSPLDKQYVAATQAALARDYAGEVRMYQAILDHAGDRDRPSAWVDLGRAQEQNGDVPSALASYQRAAQLAPDTAAPFLHIGVLESRAQHSSQARQAFEQAEKTYRAEQNMEGLAEIEYERGYLENEQGNTAEAVRHLQASLAQAELLRSPQLQIRDLDQLSSAAFDKKDQTEAIGFAKRAIDLAQNNGLNSWAAEGMVRLASSYLWTADPAQWPNIETLLQQALKIAGQSEQRRVEANANIGMANLRSAEDRNEEAIVYAQQALNYYKENHYHEGIAQASLLLARAQRNKDQLPQALESARLLEQDGQHAGSVAQVALAEDIMTTILLRQEEFPQAIEICKQSIGLSAEASKPYVARHCANALWQMGRYDEADELLRQYSPAGNSPANLIRMNAWHSRGMDSQVVALAKAANTPDANPSPEFAMVTAEANAHLGKAQQSAAEISALHPDGPEEKGQWQMATAEVALAARDFATAKANATAALAYYKGLNARTSQILASAMAAQALLALNETQNAKATAQTGVNLLQALQQSWSTQDYASFAARPDIRHAASVLNGLTEMHPR